MNVISNFVTTFTDYFQIQEKYKDSKLCLWQTQKATSQIGFGLVQNKHME